MSVFMFKNPNVVFIHIPRTAGTVIRETGFEGGYVGPFQGHVPKEWQHVFSFAFVRDPIDRFLSAYREIWRATQEENVDIPAFKGERLSIEAFAEITFDDTIPFDLQDNGSRDDFKIRIRHDTIPMTHPFHCLNQARFIGRFENVREDYARLAHYLGLNPNIPERNVVNSQESAKEKSSLSPALYQKLKDYYAEDYRFLDTEMPKRRALPDKPLSSQDGSGIVSGLTIPEIQRPKDIEGLDIVSPVFGPLLRAQKPKLGLLRNNDHSRLPKGKALIVHLDWRYVGGMMRGWCPLLDGLGRYVSEMRGVALQLWLYNEQSQQLYSEARDDQLHLVVGESLGYQNNLMHANVAYIPGYWNFDEFGVRNASSGRVKVFDPRAVYVPYATRFLTKLRALHVNTYASNYKQPDAGSVALRDQSIVFFAQYFRRPRFNRDYMTTPEMLEAAIAAKGDRTLYIKPHPLQSERDRARLQGYHDPEGGVEVVDANVHDLLEAAALTMSLSSGASFESFLHRTPTILGGQTDFGQNAITLMDPSGMKDAIEAALEQNWPYAQFVTWYLKHHCLDNNGDAVPRALDRIFRKGFAWADAKGAGFFGPHRP